MKTIGVVKADIFFKDAHDTLKDAEDIRFHLEDCKERMMDMAKVYRL